MHQNDAMKVLTGKCRLSFVNLSAPRANQPGQEPKYSVTLLIPKSDTTTKADIDQSMQAAMQDGLANTWNGVRPPNIRIPLYDGDGVRPSGEAFGPECKGHWVMTASSKMKPEVVDITGSPIMLASDIYSGMYARVTIRFFAYSNSGNKGIGCGLGNVQKLEDGEPLSGRTSAAVDFAVQPAPSPTYQPNYPLPQPGTPMYPAPQQTPYNPAAYPSQAPAYQPSAYPQPPIDPITGQPSMTVMGL